MKYCPITYEPISQKEQYSQAGLKRLSPKLKNLHPLQLTAQELRQEALSRTGKMSIQGVQLKLSARLAITAEQFVIVDQRGQFILKPQSENYLELPENEALTMTLASKIGIDVPLHGLIYGKGKAMTYFIKRFDRLPRNKKLATEDFAQLSSLSRDTKYNSSLERVVKIIANYCSYPILEFIKLYRLTLFNFLIGNEDMHLKNYSLITRDAVTMLSPAYDLLNTTIVLSHAKEELALPLQDKKNNLTKIDLFNYLPRDLLKLNQSVIDNIINQIQDAMPQWKELISISFLSQPLQKKYLDLLEKRCYRLGISF